MPYIPLDDRADFDAPVKNLADIVKLRGLSNGELNYLLTRIALMYLGAHGTSYNTISDVVKAFECAKSEFIRRVLVPYEQAKCKQNGDVYP